MMDSRRPPRPSGVDRIERMRRFNRFYTQKIGVLEEGILQSDFRLIEARVLLELSQAEEVTATQLAERLDLDPGYLSRTLAGLERRGCIARSRSESDGRRRAIRLTKNGHEALAQLNELSRKDLERIVSELGGSELEDLLAAMDTIERTLGAEGQRSRSFVLREHRAGDLGWILHRHGALYSEEQGWGLRFEAMVAKILSEFVTNYDAEHERSWVAEIDGRFAGCVLLVRDADEPESKLARLRCLLVEPFARGTGLGTKLVDECTHFAREKGYERIRLFTENTLAPARRIYQRAGYRLIEEKPHGLFGQKSIGQEWELVL